MIYLDNAATVFPKSRQMLRDMVDLYARFGVSPGRGGYDLAVEMETMVHQTRVKLARLMGSSEPDRLIFTANATDALNMAIFGLVEPGCHVTSSRLEHNSVLRPLEHLRRQGIITYDLVPFDQAGFIDPADVEKTIRPETRLVVLTHASNVLGTVQPLEDIGKICREKNVILIIDAAQSAGVIPMDMDVWHAGAVALTGHKSLLGPSGIGGLAVAPGLDINPTRFGGTGLDSKSLEHTPTFPHRLEAGTPNALGIIGLGCGVDCLERMGMEQVHQKEIELLELLRDGLTEVSGIQIYGGQTRDPRRELPVLCCNLKGMNPQDVGDILDADFDIAVRAGLHCAPLVHETIGSSPHGAIRFSIGPWNSRDEIKMTIRAMETITHRFRDS